MFVTLFFPDSLVKPATCFRKMALRTYVYKIETVLTQGWVCLLLQVY